MDATALARRLSGGSEPIGTADLLFTDRTPPADAVATVVGADDLSVLRRSVDESEWDESGLDEMDYLWGVVAPDGALAAVAGFTVWRTALAQMGVVAAPRCRGAGLAAAASGSALRGALAEGLIPQWRSRRGNERSLRLAERLGFVRGGVQAAVDVKSLVR